MLPPNPKWSQLEAFSVASLVSTLFAVPICSKLVHWDPKVMFYFTQNFIHNWTNWVQLPKTIKSGLKFAKIKQCLKNVSTFSLYIWGFNKNLQCYNATIQHTHIYIGNNSKCFVVWFPIKKYLKNSYEPQNVSL